MSEDDPRDLARATDPDTSHIAAEQVLPSLTVRRAQTLRLVQRYPGRTATQLGLIMATETHLPWATARETPHKRLVELLRRKHVHRRDKVRCPETGRIAYTWWPGAGDG